MYKIDKIPWEKRNTVFFSSDWHLFHDPKSWPEPIWKMRGYSSVEEATQDVQDKVNARVGVDDVLYYLGDLALNATDDQVLHWLTGVKCQNIRTLFGNHESCPYRLYKKEILKQYNLKDVEIYPLRMNNLVFMGNHLEIQVGKQRINMNHFPLHSWNGMANGLSWSLNGHQHYTDTTRHAQHPINKCLDVSWDSKNDIWSYEEICDVMSTKGFVPVDHHR